MAEPLDLPEHGQGLASGLRVALEAYAQAEIADELFPDLPGAAARRAGRPKGALHKATRDMAAMIQGQALNPLMFLNLVMQGHYGGELGQRIQAATALLPYLYKRQPQAIEISERSLVFNMHLLAGEASGGTQALDAAGLGGALDALAKSNEINGLAGSTPGDANVALPNADAQRVENAQQSHVFASDRISEGGAS